MQSRIGLRSLRVALVMVCVALFLGPFQLACGPKKSGGPTAGAPQPDQVQEKMKSGMKGMPKAQK